jgi:hypothetical protein
MTSVRDELQVLETSADGRELGRVVIEVSRGTAELHVVLCAGVLGGKIARRLMHKGFAEARRHDLTVTRLTIGSPLMVGARSSG